MHRLTTNRLNLFALALIAMTITACQSNEDASTLPTVITHPLTDLTHITANGGGEVVDGGGGTVTDRGVCWSVSPDPLISDSLDYKTSDGNGTGTFESRITGLTPLKTYYLKAFATNSVGTAYGVEISFTTDSTGSQTGSYTDTRDGKVYVTQKIGDQIWMAENLAYLPFVARPETGADSLPYYYVYGYDSTVVVDAKDSVNYQEYGVLYNWTAAKTSCPPGWHLPSIEEWDQLIQTVGAPAGGKLKETGDLRKPNGETHWKQPNTGATNSSGFDGIPGGIRYSLSADTTITDKFRYLTEYAVFWSSTEKDDANARAMHLYFNSVNFDKDWFSKGNGFSVRCMKNE